MTGRIYFLQDNGTLQALTEKPFANEDLLQKLLVDYPDLLAGEQIDETSPRRWLLVSREVPVPLTEEGADRMSLDHLFLDQDAVPTLIEVKRSSDTRIRREVVGQMLDYAAHAVIHWSVAGVLIAREAYVTILRHTAEARGINFAATVSGKIKMFLQSFAIGTVVIKMGHVPDAQWGHWFTTVVFVLMLVVTVFSGLRATKRLPGHKTA